MWWAALARIRPLYMEECQIVDAQNRQVAAVGQFTSSEQLEHLPSVMGRAEVVVMNAPDSQVHTYTVGIRQTNIIDGSRTNNVTAVFFLTWGL